MASPSPHASARGFFLSRFPAPCIQRRITPDCPSTVDDRDIIARVLAGERDIFHVLVERHASPLYSTLRAQLGNREDAREVFQETWLRAFAGLDTLRDGTRLRAWLVTIALNLVRARRRHALDRPGAAAEEALELVAGEHVEARLERDEELGALRQALQGLPARQREVLDLRVNHELSHAEIARLLAITEEASRANTYQALKRLKAALGPDEEGRT